jgi:hypothetical protein
MASTPIASLVACSWCGLLAERGPICDACGSPVAETSSRTTVLRVPAASRHNFRGAVPASMQPAAFGPAQSATPTTVQRKPNGHEEGREASRPASAPGPAAAKWLSLSEASVMSGVPEGTLRAWVSSRAPEDAPVRKGDPRFLLIRTPGLRLPEGLWMVDGPTPQLVPAAALAKASLARVEGPTPVATVATVAVVPRPDVPATVITVGPVSPVVRGTTPPPPPKPEPPVRAPIVAMPPQPAAPAQPARRSPALSDMYVAALLAQDVLPETWGFDASPDERKLFRRHKILTTAGVVLGFAGVAELIDFLMSHMR